MTDEDRDEARASAAMAVAKNWETAFAEYSDAVRLGWRVPEASWNGAEFVRCEDASGLHFYLRDGSGHHALTRLVAMAGEVGEAARLSTLEFQHKHVLAAWCVAAMANWNQRICVMEGRSIGTSRGEYPPMDVTEFGTIKPTPEVSIITTGNQMTVYLERVSTPAGLMLVFKVVPAAADPLMATPRWTRKEHFTRAEATYVLWRTRLQVCSNGHRWACPAAVLAGQDCACDRGRVARVLVQCPNFE